MAYIGLITLYFYTMTLHSPVHPRCLLIFILCISALVEQGCNNPLSDNISAPVAPNKPLHPVGLAAIKKRGVLRLATRNNGNTYFVLRGERLGFDFILAESLAHQLGVSLEVIVPKNWSDLIPMIQRGEADIMGAAMTITKQRARQVLFSKPYALTHNRVVWRTGTQPIDNATQLSGKQVYVRGGSSYYDLLTQLNRQLESASIPPIEIILESEALETEQILAEVAQGTIPYTLCDHHICLENASFRPTLVIGPPVSQPAPLAWAIHSNALELKKEIDLFFDKVRTGHHKSLPHLHTLYTRYYREPRRTAAIKGNKLYVNNSKQLTKFDEIFKRACHNNNIDWRLLVAIAFQESSLNPKSKSWSGGMGLFSMHPKQGKRLGAKNLYDPRQATAAVVKELNNIYQLFHQVLNPNARMKLTLAAYHGGQGHVNDARKLALAKQMNADDWNDLAQILPLLSQPKYAAKTKHGYLRGDDLVIYVTDIWERYRAYGHAFGERD